MRLKVQRIKQRSNFTKYEIRTTLMARWRASESAIYMENVMNKCFIGNDPTGEKSRTMLCVNYSTYL